MCMGILSASKCRTHCCAYDCVVVVRMVALKCHFRDDRAHSDEWMDSMQNTYSFNWPVLKIFKIVPERKNKTTISC